MTPYRFAPRTSKSIIVWLWGLYALLLSIILLGGATRLTQSGLSITVWEPISGIIPPFSLEAWNHAFQSYQDTPEYRFVNKGMTLGDFKFIYWMEFFHRLLARFIGLYVLIPLIYFWRKNKLNSGLKTASILILLLIGLQGALGWYMVKSGLKDMPHVSPYRLSAHLLMALLIIIMVLSLLFSRQYHPIPMSSKSPFWARTNLCLVIIGIFYGSLVAGMKAGLIYNSFPLMEGSWIPGEILNLKPLWLNLFENSTTVQFIHRIFAFCILVSACFGASRNWATPWYMFAVLGQIFIGVFTLLYHVPVFLGTLHQGFGVIVFSLAFWCYLKHRNFEVQKFN